MIDRDDESVEHTTCCWYTQQAVLKSVYQTVLKSTYHVVLQGVYQVVLKSTHHAVLQGVYRAVLKGVGRQMQVYDGHRIMVCLSKAQHDLSR